MTDRKESPNSKTKKKKKVWKDAIGATTQKCSAIYILLKKSEYENFVIKILGMFKQIRS